MIDNLPSGYIGDPPDLRSEAFLTWWHDHGRKICITPECAEYVFEAGVASAAVVDNAADPPEARSSDEQKGDALREALAELVSAKKAQEKALRLSERAPLYVDWRMDRALEAVLAALAQSSQSRCSRTPHRQHRGAGGP